MKEPHFVVVVNRLFKKQPKKTIIVPCTSLKEKHIDRENKRLKYFSYHLLSRNDCPYLEKDTIVDCSQIFTIDSSYLNDYRFTLHTSDVINIQQKLAYILGFDLLI